MAVFKTTGFQVSLLLLVLKIPMDANLVNCRVSWAEISLFTFFALSEFLFQVSCGKGPTATECTLPFNSQAKDDRVMSTGHKQEKNPPAYSLWV